MTTATLPDCTLITEFMNPVIMATQEVFEMMLGCVPKRVSLKLRREVQRQQSVSGVIGITGRAMGTIVLTQPTAVAIEVLRRMVGTEATTITPDVCDAVGELTNMIAGAAKAKLEKLNLSLSLPNIIAGDSYEVTFPTNVSPFCIFFESDLGPFSIEAGFCNAQ